ncbi:UbiD family decarboxylase [Romboutsia sp.]|uniref:UbiD family decarboxylase n=1 Tax=Romboutsia sp. TaxID=1965302 RepID=UPI003F41AE42
MNFRELFDKLVDFIDSYRKSIITISISMLGFILLMIVFFVSSDELSVGNESNILLKNIEQRQYSIALDYYESCEKKFSDEKMKRLNKSLSNKINKLLLDSGDKYITGQVTKEYYIGLINTVNALGNIKIDLKKIVDQADRINEMYKNENIKYDEAISYISTASILNGIRDSLDIYKYEMQEIYQSRQVYEKGLKEQKNNNYYEAIELYDKVLEEDKKYYELAGKNKKECIELMYDYYITQADESNKKGNYEESLQYIEYIKTYYIEDENVLNLEKEYEKKLSMYTLTSEDILNLIAKKSGKKKENLSINLFQQMVNEKKYYYVEVYEYDKLIDEILIDAKDRLLYSYKDSNKNYNTNYSDGYFRVKSDGTIEFAINEDKAQFILSNKLQENKVKYKSITSIEKERIYKYVSNKVDVDKILGKEADLYYYKLVNKGFFKEKQIYIINIYTQKVYLISKDSIINY